ncbi:MAG: hypothetical protein DI538_12830 [Azospira oryzae]|nr:MAG: hypothetical protein DI538_12830 [Azospira oryzae]
MGRESTSSTTDDRIDLFNNLFTFQNTKSSAGICLKKNRTTEIVKLYAMALRDQFFLNRRVEGG